MKILSLFDGISCARVALERAGISVGSYFASEIDKYAIQISQKNWSDVGSLHNPGIIHLGNVLSIKYTKGTLLSEKYGYVTDIDLLIGGSPCQDLSIAKKGREGLAGARSGLFWEYVRILKEVKPKYFILENVASMPKEARDTITEALGVEPVMINASLVSAQNRKRLFWVGKLVEKDDGQGPYTYYEKVEIPQPEDRGIMLKDILLDGKTEDLKSLCITATYASKNKQDYEKKRMGQMIKVGEIGKGSQGQRVYSDKGKSQTLSAHGGGQGAKTGLYAVALRNRGQGKKPEFGGEKANAMTTVQTDSMVGNEEVLRKLHPIECERLQGLPDGYTEGVSNTQRYKACGNAFNVDVVCHIIKHIWDGKY